MILIVIQYYFRYVSVDHTESTPYLFTTGNLVRMPLVTKEIDVISGIPKTP